MKTGVLILAYGAPNCLEDVEPFYTDIRGGRPPTPELLEELLDRYRIIGGKSPLLDITQRQTDAVQALLGDEFACYIGMRHWTPWIADTVAQMARDGITEAVTIVMAPHFSKMSIGKYHQRVEEANAALETPITFHHVDHWHTHPEFITALTGRVGKALEHFSEAERESLMVLFTAHSLPERIREWGDPYEEQLLETSRLVAAQAGIERWRFAFQSAGRTREPWLGPDILEVIEELADTDTRSVLVCVVGFIADHLEVIYDIDVEARPWAAEKGMHLERIEMLNDDPRLAECLADLIRKRLAAG